MRKASKRNFQLVLREDEDEKEVERDHYNWQLVSPFNTLVTVLIEAIGRGAIRATMRRRCHRSRRFRSLSRAL